MSNPAVLSLANLQESVQGFPYRFEIEDNVGEAIHIHYKDIRLDLTIEEFLALADAAEDLIGQLITTQGFEIDLFDPVMLAGVIGELVSAEKILDDEILLEDILVDTINEDGEHIYDSLKHSRVLRAISGDRKQNDVHHQVNYYKPHSRVRYSNQERIQFNMEQIRQKGYPFNKERILLLENTNIVWDGQHRASVLYHLYGNIRVPIRRIFFRGTEDARISDLQNRQAKLFYRTEDDGFCEKNSDLISFQDLRDGCTISLNPDVRYIRLDPVEEEHCILQDLDVCCDGCKTVLEATNGIWFADKLFFFNDDPQLIFKLPESRTNDVTLRMKILPVTTKLLSREFTEAVKMNNVIAEKVDHFRAEVQENTHQLRAEVQENALQTNSYVSEQMVQVQTELMGVICSGNVMRAQMIRMQNCMTDEMQKNVAVEGQLKELTARFEREFMQLAQERTEAQQRAELLQNSRSYRLGRMITWLPRKIKSFFAKFTSAELGR